MREGRKVVAKARMGGRCLATTIILLAATVMSAQAQLAERGRVGVLGRVIESATSERTNELGALAAVPPPQWEHRAEELKDSHRAEAAHTSELAQVGGMVSLRDRTNPLTQVLASVESYLAKIDEDISTDSSALKKDKAVEAPPKVDITKEGLKVVPSGPLPIPKITATTNAVDRGKILDEMEQRKLHKLGHSVKEEAKKPKTQWKAETTSVTADLKSAEAAINSITAFAEAIPTEVDSAAEVDKETAAKRSTAHGAEASAEDARQAALREEQNSRVASKEDRKFADAEGASASAEDLREAALKEEQKRALKEEQVLKEEQQRVFKEEHQRALEQTVRDSEHEELTQMRNRADSLSKLSALARAVKRDHELHHMQLKRAAMKEKKAVKGLHAKEQQSRAAEGERESEQAAADKEYEHHLSKELALDHKAEMIALKRKETKDLIERVEARMQDHASRQWESMQAARKRAVIRNSELLAERRWQANEQREKAKEVLWQKEQKVKKYLSEQGIQGHLGQDLRMRWEKEELEGLKKLGDTQKEAVESMKERIVRARKQAEKQARREEAVESEELAERKKHLRTEARRKEEVQAWKAQIKDKARAHLNALEAEEERNKLSSQERAAAIQKADEGRKLALEAEEERDRQHGKAVVTAADKDAELQAEQKKRMVKEEETFRQQALHEISKEERDAVIKAQAKLRLEQKARQEALANRHENALRESFEEREDEREAEIRRRQAFDMERRDAAREERAHAEKTQEAAAAREDEEQQRRREEDKAQEQRQAHLHHQALAHERKEAEVRLERNAATADHMLTLAKQHAASTLARLHARGVTLGGGASLPIPLSMSQLIAKTAADGPPNSLAVSLAGAMRARAAGGGGGGGTGPASKANALGEDVAAVMIAERRDTAKDEELRRESERKAEQADRKVQGFAARARAREEQRHARWEEQLRQAREERAALRHESQVKKAAHQQKLLSLHRKQQAQASALEAVESRAEKQLAELEEKRDDLLSSPQRSDATLMNQGARMSSLFEEQHQAHHLRAEYRAARKEVMVNKGALRIAQRQLDHLKARAESGDLSLHAAHEELQAHEKAMSILKARVTEAEESSRELEHRIFVAGQTAGG